MKDLTPKTKEWIEKFDKEFHWNVLLLDEAPFDGDISNREKIKSFLQSFAQAIREECINKSLQSLKEPKN
jgi:hypothetical protein